MSSARRVRSRRVLALAGVAAVAAACGGHSGHKAAPSSSSAPSASASASASAAPSASASPSAAPSSTSVAPTTTSAKRPGPSADPLTGSTTKPKGPLVVIKVDNSASARPIQKGLSQAGLVYQELIEGGDTRYMAIFDNPGHFQVGPVRSARPTDLHILAPFGKVVLGFSGANSGVLAQVLAGNVSAVYQERNGNAYVTEGRRPVAYNFYTWPDTLVQNAKNPESSVPTDLGLRFGKQNAGRPFTSLTVNYGRGGAPTVATWDAKLGKYDMVQGGIPMNLADGTSVHPKNLIVQFVHVHPGQYVDIDGNNSPDSIVVGKGEALILHDGKMWHKLWVRPTSTTPTRYVDDKGNDVNLDPGQTWIMIVAIDKGSATGH